MKRIFLIVLDSFGIGQMPDAAAFGDAGANTLASCAATGTANTSENTSRSVSIRICVRFFMELSSFLFSMQFYHITSVKQKGPATPVLSDCRRTLLGGTQ